MTKDQEKIQDLRLTKLEDQDRGAANDEAEQDARIERLENSTKFLEGCGTTVMSEVNLLKERIAKLEAALGNSM